VIPHRAHAIAAAALSAAILIQVFLAGLALANLGGSIAAHFAAGQLNRRRGSLPVGLR